MSSYRINTGVDVSVAGQFTVEGTLLLVYQNGAVRLTDVGDVDAARTLVGPERFDELVEFLTRCKAERDRVTPLLANRAVIPDPMAREGGGP